MPDVTILINNAAVLYHKPYLSHDPNDVENTFSVNVFSHFWVRTIRNDLYFNVIDGNLNYERHIITYINLNLKT